MSIVVFWIQDISTDLAPNRSEPRCLRFLATELSEALKFCQDKRQQAGVSHVTISSENPDSIGKRGVSEVSSSGKLPDGTDYTWKKRRV